VVSLAETFVSPVPTNASKVRVGEFAEGLSRKLGLKPGDALEPLVAQLGGKIVYHNPSRLGAAPPESIRVFSTRKFEIYLQWHMNLAIFFCTILLCVAITLQHAWSPLGG